MAGRCSLSGRGFPANCVANGFISPGLECTLETPAGEMVQAAEQPRATCRSAEALLAAKSDITGPSLDRTDSSVGPVSINIAFSQTPWTELQFIICYYIE